MDNSSVASLVLSFVGSAIACYAVYILMVIS